MANYIPSTSLFLGIIPALILLFISIKGYEKTTKHKNIFLAFIGGIIIGFIATILEIYTGDVPIYIIVLFPVFEELFKTIILNIGRLQEKPETVIYGLTLGLGMGAVATSASILRGTLQAGDYLGLGLVVLGSCGIIMLQGGTGVLIGFGVYKGKLTHYVTLAVVLHIMCFAGLFVVQVSLNNITVIVTYLLIVGLIIYWFATMKIMPRLLTESQRRKRTQKEIEIKNT
jgi:hypothetical protein